jgi:hypothetical protein
VTLPPKKYTTFDELFRYAIERARISAARNGHQEFVYWLEIAEWSREPWVDGTHPNHVLSIILDDMARGSQHPARLAMLHAHAVHCCIMLKNIGQKPPRLSLKWLRIAAKHLGDTRIETDAAQQEAAGQMRLIP